VLEIAQPAVNHLRRLRRCLGAADTLVEKNDLVPAADELTFGDVLAGESQDAALHR